MTISPDRTTPTGSPLVLLTYPIGLLKPITPLALASTLEAMTAREAAPPMWKGRMVSCVPGSPIDWAAITPPASPQVINPPPPPGSAEVDQPAPAQVTAIAFGAQAVAGLAGQRGAHLDFIDARRFQFFDQVFIEHHADRHQHHAVFRVQHFFGSGAPEDPVTQRFDHFAA